MSTQEKRIIDLLQAKRRNDPTGFRKYLPDVAKLLPDPPPVRAKPSPPVFTLTEREREYHKAGVSDALSKLREDIITPEEAAKGLQHCANLLKDDIFSLPDEAEHDSLKALIRAAIGKSLGSYKSKTIVPLDQDGKGPIVEQVSVILGVYLDLDRNGQLVSISVNPKKVRKWREIMKFVGASRDKPDVALRHDDYLAMQDPHGRF